MKNWFCLLILGISALGDNAEEISTGVQEIKENLDRGLSFLDIFNKPKPDAEVIRSCGGSSNGQKTIWKNSEYPRSQQLPGFCTLNLTPPADTCAYRVLFDDLDLRTGDGLTYEELLECSPNDPFFTATTPEDITAVYCQKMDGYEGILHVVPDTTEPTVLLLQLDPTTKFNFRVNVTAVSCDDIETFESPANCGIKNNLKQRKKLYRARDDEESQELDALPDLKSRRLSNKNKKKQTKNKKELLKQGSTSSKGMKLFKKAIAEAVNDKKLVEANDDKEKVLGIFPISVHEYPWIVYIEMVYGDDFAFACNGILVDADKVLTSRFCAIWGPQQPFGVENMKVYIGDHDVFDSADVKSKTVTVSKVSMLLRNGVFDTEDHFAILHLSETLEFSDTIKPICMPVDNINFRKNSAVIAGWDMSGEAPPNLPWSAKVKLTDKDTCNFAGELVKLYINEVSPEFNYNIQYDSEDIVCTLDRIFEVGNVCEGEGGSTLIQRDTTGAFYLTGVTGGLNVCLFEGFPTVLSKVDVNNQFLNIALA